MGYTTKNRSGGKSIISFAEIYKLNNILFFLRINSIMHFPGGFAYIFSAVRTQVSLDMHGLDD